jgi:hypothetical protein
MLMFALPASAAERPAGVYCVGDTVTVSWTPPADTTGLSGYLVEHRLTNPAVDGWTVGTTTVGLDQTSVSEVLSFGLNNYIVWLLDASGQRVGDVGTSVVSFVAGKTPQSAAWASNLPGAPYNSVGDGSATVTFGWAGGPITVGTTGWEADTLTISGAGQPASYTLTGADNRFGTPTFTGLTNGQPYTFTSDIFNACGDGGSAVSGTFVPGVAPVWIANTPPLTNNPGVYRYQFHASGKPAPSSQLADAPSWLSIDRSGLVSGHPPKGTTQFSYSVVAHNGVGFGYSLPITRTDITTGPFTVTVAPS